MEKIDLKCEVCGNPAIGVCSSTVGPISHAFCKECLVEGRQPWSTLLGGLFGCRKDYIADWAIPIIEATCKFYKKTVDEFWEEMAQIEKEHKEYAEKMSQQDQS